MSADRRPVRLTIDDREVDVAPGTGVVEAALQAGIEIPVFCYEPRLGAPVGACRMCLCEVSPGPPKPQAACTLTAAEGMVVRTALTSELAAEAQRSTLEFILVNHPLDCPVCDKGGECPLQDLSFRYGEGVSRMAFAKRTLQKPIPISPTIALDRERCILCYRCTRFSESIAEDGQLVAVGRGAASVIATFADEPYRAPFSGNVIELCPVGALTSTQYRFEARPWEIQNVPTVCGHCPVGCNLSITTREGRVKRVLSRNHPEVDRGWLCDKGRFAFGQLRASDRIGAPLQRVSERRFEPLAWEVALERAEGMLRRAGPDTLTVVSGSETVEQAYALARLMRAGLGAHAALLPEAVPDALDAYRAPLSAIAAAGTVVVVCDEPVVERAPIVELWIKEARRQGATVIAGVPSKRPERPVLVCDEAEAAAAIAASIGAEAVYYLPRSANARGVSDAWSAASDGEPSDGEPRLVVVSGDEAASDPAVRDVAARASAVLGIGMFEESFRGLADLVLPGTDPLERDGTTVNLEGRLQRQRRAVIAPCPDELAWIARLAGRFGVELSPHPAAVFEELSPILFGGIPFSSVSERSPLPSPVPGERPAGGSPAPKGPAAGKGLRLVRYRPLFSGPAVERTSELAFQRPGAEIELSAEDARARGILAGAEVVVSGGAASARLVARIASDLAPGTVRIPEAAAPNLQAPVEVAP